METKLQPPLYRQIAERMETMIVSGSLRAGDRMPSLRHLSHQHQVSMPTVMQAYEVLENRRFIEARPKSGFYVRARLANALKEPSIARHQPEVTSLTAFASVLAMHRNTPDSSSVQLGVAVPGDELLPLDKLAQITSSLARRATSATVGYDLAPGCLALRNELSKRSMDSGCNLDADDFIVTVGTSEALHLALLAVTKPGDTVLIESPAYYGTLNLLSQLKLNVVSVPACPGDGLDMEFVRSAIRLHPVAAMLVIPNFSNPLGSFMPEANRHELLALSHSHGIPIIEDDIYGDLPHSGPRPRCLKALEGGENVILCASFSKTLAPGLRVGYMAAGKYQSRVMELKIAFNLGGSSLAALTVAEFLRSGGYERHLRKLRHAFRQQVCRMREALAEEFPDGTKVSNPLGGFVLWVELPEKADVLSLFREARAAGIHFVPGPLCSPEGRFNNCLRLSCGSPWDDRTEKAVRVLARMIKRQLRDR